MFAFAVLSAVLLGAPVPGNPVCPVTSDEASEAEHWTVYKGRRIHFCCADCIEQFLEDPDAYAGALPDLETLPKADPAAASPKFGVATSVFDGGDVDLALPPDGAIAATREALRRDAPAMVVALLLLWIWVRRGGRPRAGPVVAGVVLGGALVAAQAHAIDAEWDQRRSQLGYYAKVHHAATEQELLDSIHFVTYDLFGKPPKPRRMAGPNAIRRTYYRGNDERTPRLFNGGRYRTTTFDIGLVAGGAWVEPGATVNPAELGIRVAFRRGPSTPDFFWVPKRMARAYLTMDAAPFAGRFEPVADRVGLTTDEPMQRWSAVYPVGALVKTAPGDRRHAHGIVYLCEERYRVGQLVGGRFHYGIEFDLHLDADGVLLKASDVWMNATYVGRKFAKHQIPPEEWFSDRPIPEKPKPDDATPEELGLTDYEEPGDL